jgi:nucleotide-binding universal stress UspA family protein
MIDLKRILLPTDFSKFSQSAFQYAAALAEKFGAEIYLLHVVQNLSVMIPDMITVTPAVMPSVEQLTASVRSALERLVKENQLDSTRLQLEVREGTPFYEIIQFAKEKEIDLIVMGTHGHTGLAHMLLGSVTEKVVRKAPCPVLTVRHPEHEFVHP